MADVSAKDGSQETLVNLTALLFSLVLIPAVTDNQNVSEVFLVFTFNYSRLRLIRPHQNTNFFVRINRGDELRVPFNIGTQ